MFKFPWRRRKPVVGREIETVGTVPMFGSTGGVTWNQMVAGQEMSVLYCPGCHSLRVAPGQEAKAGGKSLGMVIVNVGPIYFDPNIPTELVCMECGKVWREKG